MIKWRYKNYPSILIRVEGLDVFKDIKKLVMRLWSSGELWWRILRLPVNAQLLMTQAVTHPNLDEQTMTLI